MADESMAPFTMEDWFTGRLGPRRRGLRLIVRGCPTGIPTFGTQPQCRILARRYSGIRTTPSPAGACTGTAWALRGLPFGHPGDAVQALGDWGVGCGGGRVRAGGQADRAGQAGRVLFREDLFTHLTRGGFPQT